MRFYVRTVEVPKRGRTHARPKFMRWIAIGWLAVWTCVAGMAQEAGPRGPIRTLVVDGKTLRYKVSGDLAITEGDIVLGNAADLEAFASGNTKSMPREAALYLGGLGTPNLWTSGTLYYTIAGSLPNQQRVLDAVAHWNARTPLKVLPWTGQTNYVRFIQSSDGGCSSTIGMVGGQQTIQLGSGCPAAAAIHEIGHAFGLMHEQSRRDRDRWLTVLYENIDDYDFDQFHQDTNERDLGYYDYGSIMHYSAEAFSVDGGTSLETVPPGIPIGQRVGLSAGDIDAISRIYSFIPTQTTVTTIPEGLTIVVDGERFVAPKAFNWTPGSQHTLAVDATQPTASARNVFVRWTDGGTQSHAFTATADQTAIAAEFQQYFQVTTGVNVGNGTVTVTPTSADGYYLAGTNLKITAKAGAGQALYTWRGTEVQNYGFGYSADVLTIPVREAVTFKAEFSAAPMTLVDASPSGAEVVVDNSTYVTPVRFINGWTVGSTHTLAPSTPQYSPTSSSKLVFGQWDDGSNSSTRSIQVGATAATYTATYKVQHFLNYDWTGSGSVSASPSGSAYYDLGSSVTVTAIPRFNNRLQYWLGSGIGGSALNQTIVMNQPKYAFAVFGSALDFRPTNAASYSSNLAFDQAGTNVAPLEIVTLFGTGLGPATLTTGVLDGNGRLASTLAGTRILFDGVPAPIIYASDTQTAVIVPAEVASRTFTVVSAERNGTVGGITTASVIPSLPGIFTANASGSGPIAAFNEDYSLNSPSRPAAPGSVVTLYATGAGLMDRTLVNGAIMDGNLARPQLPVYVRIGTEPAQVEYAGSAPTLVNGALQVNVRIPATAQSGNQPIKLVVGTAASAPGPTIAIR